jgi:hypothetical protein
MASVKPYRRVFESLSALNDDNIIVPISKVYTPAMKEGYRALGRGRRVLRSRSHSELSQSHVLLVIIMKGRAGESFRERVSKLSIIFGEILSHAHGNL